MGLRTAVLAIAGVIALCACKGPRTSGPIPQRGYLWQRDWTPAVIEALDLAQSRLVGVVVLAADIDWSDAKPEIVRPAIDWKKINSLGRPCAVALRIAPFAARSDRDNAHLQSILEVAESIFEQARHNGVQIAEFQLDFDCPQRELTKYAGWIRSVRSVTGSARLIITTLPAWLGEPAFTNLVRQTDGFVLQVHSVPTKNGESATLCDPQLAKSWVEKAARLHRPFSVALPTYRCSAGYDPNGKLISVAMDSIQPTWPPNTRVLEFSANADAIAMLVNEWENSRPVELQELIWYRLPVSTDLRNWQWKTLAAVSGGRKPVHQLTASQQGADLCDISIANTGEADEPLDAVVTASWNGTAFVAADALPGWHLDVANNRAVFSKADGHRPILPPGANRKIGWLRYSRFTSLRLDLTRNNESPR